MEDLIQIILTLDPRKIRHIDILSNEGSTSNSGKLYKAIVSGDIAKDEDAAELIYGDKATKSKTKFINLKKDLEERVLNTLLFINPENDKWDDIERFKLEANRLFFIIKCLLFNSFRDFAIEKAEALLKKTIYYEYTEITVELLGVIQSHYALKGEEEKFEKIFKDFEYYAELLNAERKARNYKDTLKVRYVKSVAYRPENTDLAKKYYDELKPYLEKYNSYSLHLNAYLLEVYIYLAKNDYQGWFEVVERALTYIQSKPFNFNSALLIFLGQKCASSTYLKNYDIAEEAIDISIKLAPKGAFNWFKEFETKMFLLFRMKHYQEAYNTYKEIISIPEFKTLDGLNKEIWQLFFVHFYLIHKLGDKIKLPESAKSPEGHNLKNFSFKTFKNDTPTFEHDKRGMNLILHVLEICIKIAQGKSAEIIDREEGIKKQFARYADKTDQNYRVALFGRMLLVLARFQDDTTELKIQLEPLLDDFSKTDNRMSETMYRAEAIELEDVWKSLLEKIEVDI